MRPNLLLGIALCCGVWICSAKAPHGAVIEASVIPGFSELPAGSGPAAGAAAGTSDWPLARAPLGNDVEAFVSPSCDCNRTDEPAGSAGLPASDLSLVLSAEHGIGAFEMSAAASAFDFAVGQQSIDSLQPLSAGAAPALLDQLFSTPEETDDPDRSRAGSDVFVSYVVPALAFLALLLTGLLLRELVRRRQRAASARRIRRSFGRSIRRGSASRTSRTAGDGRR